MQEYYITAIGPPSAPEIQVEEISAELELQWNEPFTWPGYPVLDYSVTREDFPGNIVESEVRPIKPSLFLLMCLYKFHVQCDS